MVLSQEMSAKEEKKGLDVNLQLLREKNKRKKKERVCSMTDFNRILRNKYQENTIEA